MKKRIYIIVIGTIFILHGYAQTHGIQQYLEKIPRKQQSVIQSPLNYQLTIDWTNRSVDKGEVIVHNVAVGKLIQASPNDTIQMQDVTLREINNNAVSTRNLEELNGLKF